MDGSRSPNRNVCISLGVDKCLSEQEPAFLRWTSEDGATRLQGNGSESASQSDLHVVANRVFYEFAPFWYMAQTWHCKRINTENSQNVFVLKGPFSSKEMFNIYTSRRTMKGSNLIVGVASKSVVQKGALIPPTFFRTLGHIFELAKSGVFYKAVTADDITRGSAQPGFSLQNLPLWLTEPRLSPNKGEVGIKRKEERKSSGVALNPECPKSPGAAVSPSEDLSAKLSTSPAGKTSTYRDSTTETAGAQGKRLEDAESLFSTAPFWCYLYLHELQQSKKTPPKTSKEMMLLYRHGCLPGWTPVIGLQESVAMCNSIPPSLFLPLAALLDLGSLTPSCTQAKPSTFYTPIGPKELSIWDKFKGMRGAQGQTARLGLSMRLSGSQASIAQPSAQGVAEATTSLPRSLRRQFQSMSNMERMPLSSSNSNRVPPYDASLPNLSVNAPSPFSSMGASAGALGGSLPASPYQYSPVPVPAMFYCFPHSSYSMHYPTHYMPNGYSVPFPSQPLNQHHSEPYPLPKQSRHSGLVTTVEENEVEATDNNQSEVDSLLPPTSTIAPENLPSANGSAAEAGNSSMGSGSAGIRSIIGSAKDSSDSSKWPSSSDGPSMDSVIPQPPTLEDRNEQGQGSGGGSGKQWSSSLFRIILGPQDHQDLSWFYYYSEEKEMKGSEGAQVLGPFDSESMLIKMAGEKSLDKVFAARVRKSESIPPQGEHPDLSTFTCMPELLAASR